MLVCSLESEPIPGALRYGWMRELFPDVRVVHVTDENPQEPHEHPEFWRIWTDTVLRHAERPDVVFTSEAYGWELARRLGAEHVPVDLGRELVPISGTAMRDEPLAGGITCRNRSGPTTCAAWRWWGRSPRARPP